MTWLSALFLGALQGVTEFLPISSSGHLVLAQYFLRFEDDTSAKEIFFDGVLHLGTLLAVLAYFGREVAQHMRRVLVGAAPAPVEPTALVVGMPANDLSLAAEAEVLVEGPHVTWPSSWPQLLHLAGLVALATLPAAILSIAKGKEIADSFKRPEVVAGNFLILGAVLLTTDVLGRRRRGRTIGPDTQWWQALLIGCAQACSAVFRGLSRSGMTIGASLLLGLERPWAVRFSFFMSVVASLGLGLKGIRDALKDPQRSEWMTPEFLVLTLAATLVSAVVGYLTITPLIRLVQRCQLWWFAVYVWVVGLAVLFFREPIRTALHSAFGS